MATITADRTEGRDASPSAVGLGALAVAGLASLGGGAIHAAAIGVHNEHRQAALAFAVLGFLQLAWGVAALVGRRPLLALAGLAVNGAAVGGWVMAKTTGIGFVDGLGEAEGIQWTDFLAAVLAAVAVLVAARVLLQGRRAPAGPPRRLAVNGAAAVVAVVSLFGMNAAGTHSHAGGHGHGGSEAAAGADDGHDHPAGDDAAATGDEAEGHDHGTPAAVAPKPYDPTKPIDLGGVAGVTEEQQAKAENLIAITLDRLPQFADQATAKAQDYYSIGDAGTGFEHLINWNYVNDEHTLNPDFPEALVYEVGPGDSRTLVSAMFMLETGSTLKTVPELGGPLTQWHIHDDLCFSDDPVSPHVAGITSVGGECRPPTTKLEPVPMIHVWITPHPCGPFAALEGVGAGQIGEGEERLCDHAHGA